ncbi:MAG: S8 family serine peptidase [Phycisphaerae bacterium]|nr:S8 family serine peptidase [Phycisphaerae bacterium]
MKCRAFVLLISAAGSLSVHASSRPRLPSASMVPATATRPSPVVGRPNDPLFGTQYYFETMNVLEAWRITAGSPTCLVGVLDTGFDLKHPDLRGNLLPEYQAEGMEHPDSWPVKHHGTAVAGLIAAKANNGIGLAGLAPECRILPAAYGTHALFRERTPEASRQWNILVGQKQAQAMRYLVDKGCRVINCSFTPALSLKAGFEYAIAHDVVVVVASGNVNSHRPAWPAGVLDVLCVGGVDQNDQRWVDPPKEVEVAKGQKKTITQGSAYGIGLNVVAPMRGLAVCTPRHFNDHLLDDQWKEVPLGKAMRWYLHGEKGGTSYATPMATALVALIRSLRPDLDYRQVIKIVEQGADDLGEKGWDKYTGWGRINFAKSLKLAQSWPKAR